MSGPDVSVIIVSWNTRDYLARCLAAIPVAGGGLATEVIAIDNGSSDGTQAMLASEFPEVRLIQNPDNVGFARANNIGARASRGRALLLLNSDCDLGPEALQAMVGELERDGSLGGVFCRLVNPDRSLQPSVHRGFPSLLGVLGELLGLSSLRYAVYRRPALHPWLLRGTVRAHARAGEVAWGGAACMLVRREAFEAVGGFDERFFLYWEDVDLCRRIRSAGYRLRYLPEPVAVHHWGKSASQLSAVALREAYRSRLLYFRKHFPTWAARVVRGVTLVELSLRRALYAVLALFPSRFRQAFNERHRASTACLRSLSG